LASFIPAWNHYQRWFFEQSVASLYGLGDDSKLRKIPAWAHIMPWGKRSPRQMTSWLPPRIRRNRKNHGAQISGWSTKNQIMRLDSELSAESHGNQFFDLATAFSTGGAWAHCNTTDPFSVWSLQRKGESRWFVYSGNHRIAAYAVSGISEVHAELEGVVIEEEVDSWHNVRNGSFTRREALGVFDNLFQGALLQTAAVMIDTLPRRPEV
jgi:hypothetical protein